MSDFLEYAKANQHSGNCTRAEAFTMGQRSRQSEIDQLKAKNTALVHALVNTNAERAKWASDYWKQVERTAEYGAMLISSDSDLAVSCFKKEKEIEKLKAEKAVIQNLVKSLRSEFDLNGGSDQVERQIELLEEAVRGEQSKHPQPEPNFQVPDELKDVAGFIFGEMKKERGNHE